MIIDEILDRRAGCKYDPEYLVDIAETDGFDNVVKAFKSKDENAAKTALKEYTLTKTDMIINCTNTLIVNNG